MSIRTGPSMASSSLSIPRSSTPILPRTMVKTHLSVRASHSSNFPNENEPFAKKLQSPADNSPEKLHRGPVDREIPPYMDVFYSPRMSYASEFGGPVLMRGRKPRSSPPDLASLSLSERIIYITLPLVPLVTELVTQQAMYLQWMDPEKPIHIYINSSGTTREDGEPIARDAEGLAIYDALMAIKNEIYTVGMGLASGWACLLLACGKKGKRYMFPKAEAMLHQPRLPPTGLMSTSDALARTDELLFSRDRYISLMAKHTGHSEEVIAEKSRTVYHMDCVEAKRFGIIDKILWRGQEKSMKEWAPPDCWNTTAMDRS